MIEDDTELAEILTEYLEQFDMQVQTAEEPYIGLSTLATSKFDLVILDLTLPGLDGLEVCKEIRKNTTFLSSSLRQDTISPIKSLLWKTEQMTTFQNLTILLSLKQG